MVLLVAQHISEHPEEIGYVMAVLTSLGYIAKHFLSKRRYEKKLRGLERKMENEADGSLSGSSNPGRTTVDLLDVMYTDIKDIKKTLTRHEGEIGKLKGKVGLN